jgi:hypothetical protein
MGELQQAAIRGIRQDGEGLVQCGREAEIAITAFQVGDPRRRNAVERLANDRVVRGFSQRRVQRARSWRLRRGIEHQFEAASSIGHGIQPPHRVGRRALFPPRQGGGEQLGAAAKVPVEAALRDAEPGGERASRIRSFGAFDSASRQACTSLRPTSDATSGKPGACARLRNVRSRRRPPDGATVLEA